jgi:hypothetical protein
VAADHLIELVIGERIRQIVQIMNHIGRRARIDVHSNRACDFVGSAADI